LAGPDEVEGEDGVVVASLVAAPAAGWPPVDELHPASASRPTSKRVIE
jgi:hypothetical protein